MEVKIKLFIFRLIDFISMLILFKNWKVFRNYIQSIVHTFMRVSSIKNRINTLSTHHLTYNQYPTVQSPQAHDLSKLTQNYHDKNNYQSNYHYFSNRIGVQNTNQIEKNQKITHQRYMSLGNSRTTVRNSLNSESSPYLMNFGTNERKKTDQAPKFIQKNCQQKLIIANPESKIINRLPMKMSMKNVQRKQARENNEKYYFMKESQVSTVNQTNNTGSISSKLAQQKLKKDQLIKYLSSNLQNSFNELKSQVKLQNKMIQKLQQKIGKLNTNLLEKQKVISTLLNSGPQKQSHFIQNTFVQKCNQLVFKSITSKIKNLQAFNQSIKNKLIQQSDIQVQMNKKIDRLIIELEKAEKNKLQRGHWRIQIRNVVLNIDKFKNYLIQNKKMMQQTQEIKKLTLNLKQMCGLLKKIIYKTQKSSNEMQETAQFKNDIEHSSKIKCENEFLNDSASYFFHPSQLSNIQKITELFINRQGQPIQCYIDNLNQVRYKDTNTFMFSKKGDIVLLSECQKRYYIDKGFIVKNK